jgi:hypothetical protein
MVFLQTLSIFHLVGHIYIYIYIYIYIQAKTAYQVRVENEDYLYFCMTSLSRNHKKIKYSSYFIKCNKQLDMNVVDDTVVIFLKWKVALLILIISPTSLVTPTVGGVLDWNHIILISNRHTKMLIISRTSL